MPNNFATRYILKGAPVDGLVVQEYPLPFFPQLAGTPWKTGLHDSIAGTGKLVRTPGQLQFSSYMAWHMHEEEQLALARLLPPGITMTVAGLDIDDYHSDNMDGALCVFSTGPGAAMLSCDTHMPAKDILTTYFPSYAAGLLAEERLTDGIHAAQQAFKTATRKQGRIKESSRRTDTGPDGTLITTVLFYINWVDAKPRSAEAQEEATELAVRLLARHTSCAIRVINAAGGEYIQLQG